MRRFLLSLIGFVSFVFLLLPTFSHASENVFTLSFDPSDLIFDKVQGYDRVKMVDGRFSAEPGTPLLPVKFVQMAIPADVEVERVEVISSAYQQLPGTYRIYPAQPFYPVSSLPTKGEEVEFVEADPSVYGSSGEYPGILAKVTNNGFLGGQHIAGVAMYPLHYVPSEGKLVLYTQIEFKLIFKPSSRSPAPVNTRSQSTASFYSDAAKSIVINPEAVRVQTKGFLSQGQEVDYLIITDDSFVWAFQRLADWKIQKGISTEIKELSWVLSNYSGYDEAEQIRNCIRDYYSNHGTKWALLGGDPVLLDHRAPIVGAGMYVEYVPCDLYFSDLDSNWDANGNQIYGEYQDEVDMYPDVFVGRAPSKDPGEAIHFVNKCLTYEIHAPPSYQTRALFAAEVPWPETDAAELKDYIDTCFIPDHFQTTKLYQTSDNLNRTTFRDALNEGQNIVNHCGHGSWNVLSIGPERWFSSDMDELVNSPHYSLFYSYGCFTAAMDWDCIAEHFINVPGGGGIAYCGNTRFGWGAPGAPLEGPGSEFDIEFFRAIFDGKDYQVGKALGNSKIPFVPLAQEPWDHGPYARWTMFTLVLLGDPTLELWTNIPSAMFVSHAPACVAGMSYFEVDVDEDSALVACVGNGQILGKAYSSGGSAMITFDSPLVGMDTMHVTVTKHDCLPYRGVVSVMQAEGPYVIYLSHQTDDSQGNNNGVVNPDETILMSVAVKNIGVENAQNVSATLREDDPYVAVTDSVKSFGDIDSGMTAVSMGDYMLEISASCPDSHVVEFNLEATDGDTSWVTRFYQMVVEPDFIMAAIPDTIAVHQGDSCFVRLILTSISGFNWQVDLNHTTLPTGVSGVLDPGQLIPTDSSVFRTYVEPDAPLQVQVITVTASGGGITREREIVVGIAPPQYYGPLWHVSTEGSDLSGNGTQEAPFRTIQRGIDGASDGDTVLAESGRYVENIDFSGKVVLLASRFIYDGLESTVESTVIDGNHRGSVVTFNSGEDSGSAIRGFTLTGGEARYGAGLYCYLSSPTIADNSFRENEANFGGSAIFCYGSEAAIHRNLITDCSGSAAINLIGNGGVHIVDNTVCTNGSGGLYIQGESASCVKNNIFYGNGQYGILAYENLIWAFLFNDAYGQEYNYAGMLDLTGVNGNISADPLFEDRLMGNYHLMPTSPCVDAGDPDDPVPPQGGTRIDMGAFEYEKQPDFAITGLPDSVLILVEDSASFALTLTSYRGFNSLVDLSYSDFPSGVGVELEPNQLVPTASSTLRIYVSASVPTGVYLVAITATGGGITHHKHVMLDVRTYNGPVWHVCTDGDDSSGDGSEELPFRTIGKGIEAAWNGDTVLVDRGKYLENINFCGKAILVGSRFILDGLESTIESTVIDGNYQGSVVTFDSGEDSNSVIKGFTITKGYASYGSGVRCIRSSPTITHNFVVRDSSYWGYAGGVGIYCRESYSKIYRNLIADCVGPAAVLCVYGSDVELFNNTIANNSAGGLSVQGSAINAKNNILSNNYAYGIHIHVEESIWQLSHNDSYGHDENWAEIPDQTGFNGNISADPLFADTSAGDYHLTAQSPCIDAGDLPGTDMGAFEYGGPSYVMTVIPDTAVVYLEDSTSVMVILNSVNGFDSLVDLSHSELPPEVTGSLDQNQLVPTDSCTFRISATSAASLGTYTVTITATGGGITRERELVLNVLPVARTWYVSTTGDDSTGDGTDESPFKTIQKGINAAYDVDTVLVEVGRYVENLNLCGKSILVASHFIFSGLESIIRSTVIDGNHLGSVVTFDSGEDSNCVIRGFTLTGGLATYGGGICCIGSSPAIAENFIVENACGTWDGGPGIFCGSGSNAKIYKNLVANCSGPSAIFVSGDCTTLIANNTVCDNDAGGLSIQWGSIAYVNNNIFCNNVAYGIHTTGHLWYISHNDVYGHDENYAGIDDQTGVNGNISADPLFVNPSGGDYHLAEGSPCIGAGDPTGTDLGAFEYFERGDANGDGEINAQDVVYLIGYLFRGGPPPYLMNAGDANNDGGVNAADVVYLIQYLFHGGPPPPAKRAAIVGRLPAQLWLSERENGQAGATAGFVIRGTFEVDIAAVQLTIQVDQQKPALSLTLPPGFDALQIFSSQKDTLLKVGILDVDGGSWIPAGQKTELLILDAKGANLNSLEIKQAILSDRNGLVVPVKIITEEQIEEQRPESFSLSQNYPNPFNPYTQINYALPLDCDVKITVYNLLGQRVRVLVDEHEVAGHRRIHWDGKDEQGVDVASGVYFCKIQAGKFTDTKKMILLK